MTKEELAKYKIATLEQIIPGWSKMSLATKSLIESTFNLEWWRGYHAARPVEMQHVRMGQPAPAGTTHIILGTEDYEQWRKRWAEDRHDHDLALHDAISETARIADELAFWRYQAVFIRAYLHDSMIESWPIPEDSPSWQRAERELEALRRDENRSRHSHAEPGRDPGAT